MKPYWRLNLARGIATLLIESKQVALQRTYLLESINVYEDNLKGVLNMATLVAIKFPTAEGANTMLHTLEGLQMQQLIEIHDGAIVSWPTGASKPKTSQLSKSVVTGASRTGWCVLGYAVRLAVLYPDLRPGGRRSDRCFDGALFELWYRPELHRPGASQGHPRHFGFIPVVDWGSG